MAASESAPDPAFLGDTRTNAGETLQELSQRSPVLVVFLRHAGCPFCRQALADLSEHRGEIASAGTSLVLVHMTSDAAAEKLFAAYGLQDVPRISDPEQRLYAAFGLSRGGLLQVAGPSVWLPGLKSLLSGNVPGIPSGDVRQMPGAFLLQNGRILRAFRPANSAERPDYCALATCRPPAAGT